MRLHINVVLIERIDTLRKIFKGWLVYDSDTIHFFEHIHLSRVPGGQLRTCLLDSNWFSSLVKAYYIQASIEVV